MSHGGARSGAGRKPGSKPRKSAEVALRAAAEGVTPIQIMLKAMRAADENGDTDAAARYAQMAAPYCHPRLSAVEVGGEGGGPVRLAVVEELVDDAGDADGQSDVPPPPEATGLPQE